MQKKKKKEHSDVIIPHSKSLWVGIIVFGLFLSLVLCVFWKCGHMESIRDVILARLVMSIPILFSVYAIILSVLRYQDYVKFSMEGIEYVLHPDNGLLRCNKGFVSWEDVKEYTVTETYPHSKYYIYCVRYLVLNLYDKEKPLKLSFESLHGRGKNIRHYVNMFSDCKYYVNYDEIFKKEKPSWYYPKKVKKDDES